MLDIYQNFNKLFHCFLCPIVNNCGMIFTTKGRMAVPNRMSFKKWSKFMLPFFETLNRALWSWNRYKMVNRSRNDFDQLLLWMVPTANYGQLIQIIIPTQKYDTLFHYMVQTVLQRILRLIIQLNLTRPPTQLIQPMSSTDYKNNADNYKNEQRT